MVLTAGYRHCGTAGGGHPRTLAPGRGRPGLAPGVGDTEEGANTHATVVLSNCSARPSMADDCKYGSSLSVCLSVRSVSVLASPVPVSCGCPRPARALLRPPVPPAGPRPLAARLAPAPAGFLVWGGNRTWTLLGCLDLGVRGSGLGRGRCWAAGAVPRVRGSRGRAEPNFVLRAGGAGGHWSRSRGSGVCRAHPSCLSFPVAGLWPW